MSTKMIIRSYLDCKICNKILRKPITLPCSCTVCYEHVNENKSGTFNCLSCNENIQTPMHGFKINKILDDIIVNELYLTDEERNLKRELCEASIKLRQLAEECEQKKSEFKELKFEHVDALKQKVHLRREILKKEIDHVADEIVEDIERNIKAFVRSSLESVESATDCEDFAEIFRSQQLDIDKLMSLHAEKQQRIEALQTALAQFDLAKQDIDTGTFKAAAFKFERVYFGLLRASTCGNLQNMLAFSWNDTHLFYADLRKQVRVIQKKNSKCQFICMCVNISITNDNVMHYNSKISKY